MSVISGMAGHVTCYHCDEIQDIKNIKEEFKWDKPKWLTSFS